MSNEQMTEEQLKLLESVINVKFFRQKGNKMFFQRVKLKTLQNKNCMFNVEGAKGKRTGTISAFDDEGRILIYSDSGLTPIMDDEFCVII